MGALKAGDIKAWDELSTSQNDVIAKNKGMAKWARDDPSIMISPTGKPRPSRADTMFDIRLLNTNAVGKSTERTISLPFVESTAGLGLVLKGNAPVLVHEVDRGSSAAIAGVKLNEAIIEVDGVACSTAGHKQVVRMFTDALTRAKAKREVEKQGRGGKTGPLETMVVASRDYIPDAGLGDVNLVLPGQISDVQDTGNPGDPYAPIREAASQHQVEAARLMQAGSFQQARVLLDRAINLLSSIPQVVERYISLPAPTIHCFFKFYRNPSSVLFTIQLIYPHPLFYPSNLFGSRIQP